MKFNKLLLFVTTLLLLIVDFLTFHDFFEAHTPKDWLILTLSITFLIYVARAAFKKDW